MRLCENHIRGTLERVFWIELNGLRLTKAHFDWIDFVYRDAKYTTRLRKD